MCGRATFAMEVSRTSMKAASATVAAISQGLTSGLHRLLTSAVIRYPSSYGGACVQIHDVSEIDMDSSSLKFGPVGKDLRFTSPDRIAGVNSRCISLVCKSETAPVVIQRTPSWARSLLEWRWYDRIQ